MIGVKRKFWISRLWVITLTLIFGNCKISISGITCPNNTQCNQIKLMINRENDDITSPNFCALKFLLWLQIDESMPICPFFLTKKVTCMSYISCDVNLL